VGVGGRPANKKGQSERKRHGEIDPKGTNTGERENGRKAQMEAAQRSSFERQMNLAKKAPNVLC